MKLKRMLFLLGIALVFLTFFPMDAEATSILLSLNPIALTSGYIAGTVEVVLSKSLTLYIYPSYFSSNLLPFSMNSLDVSVWSFSSVVGLNYYFKQNAPKGTFMGAGIIGGYLRVSDVYATIDGPLVGVAYRFGYRWIWNHFSIAPNASIRFESLLADISSLTTQGKEAAIGLRNRFGMGIAVAF